MTGAGIRQGSAGDRLRPVFVCGAECFMKVSDYIVEFMVRKGVTDFFGYQGTMIAHLVDSIARNPAARNHSSYHEQGAAFAACGYAQAKGSCAFAYATSGPGAVNLLSGVANAYFDSLPVIFVTGQLNTYEYSGIRGLRQQGFQEIDIVSMAAPVTKRAVKITRADDILRELPLAWELALGGRRGPVLLDIPMNIQRGEIELPVYDCPDLSAGAAEDSRRCPAGPEDLSSDPFSTDPEKAALTVAEALRAAHRPVVLMGQGVQGEARQTLIRLVSKWQIPVITSVLARDAFSFDDPLYFGCIGGAYGHRYANMIASAKSDLLLCFGISLCTRQIGTKIHEFAPRARLIRIDIDPYNLQRRIHEDAGMENCFCVDAGEVLRILSGEKLRDGGNEPTPGCRCPGQPSGLEEASLTERGGILSAGTEVDVDREVNPAVSPDWVKACRRIRTELEKVDDNTPERWPNRLITRLSEALEDSGAIAVDVGQHMVWTYQSLHTSCRTHLLFSGGHGAMGYALPAAIGAHFATGGQTVCICGDGSFQMNIQELQWVFREKLPVLIIVFNNQSLGMIRHLQRDYFDNLYEGTSPEAGFTSGSFSAIADAYGIRSLTVQGEEMLEPDSPDMQAALRFLKVGGSGLLEIRMAPGTYAYPKTCLGEPIFRQQPYADEETFEELMKL